LVLRAASSFFSCRALDPVATGLQTMFGYPLQARISQNELQRVMLPVEVDDEEIRIHGRKSELERLVMTNSAITAGVPSFVRQWRARKDSNL
jgi:hypothetical protein